MRAKASPLRGENTSPTRGEAHGSLRTCAARIADGAAVAIPAGFTCGNGARNQRDDQPCPAYLPTCHLFGRVLDFRKHYNQRDDLQERRDCRRAGNGENFSPRAWD